jgi:transcriptional regulator with XRE-family HTH domain
MEELDVEIGQKLKKLREEHGYSMRDVATKIGIDHSYIGKIEKGKFPSLDKLKKLCEVYGVTVQSLIGQEVAVPDELKELGVKWITLSNHLVEKGLSVEDLLKYTDVIKSLKNLK